MLTFGYDGCCDFFRSSDHSAQFGDSEILLEGLLNVVHPEYVKIILLFRGLITLGSGNLTTHPSQIARLVRTI